MKRLWREIKILYFLLTSPSIGPVVSGKESLHNNRIRFERWWDKRPK